MLPFFLGTHLNRVDKKGRVSVPATFRTVLEGSAFSGVVALRSFQVSGLEAFSLETMQQMAQQLEQLELFSPKRSWLEAALFGNAQQLSFDSEGRLVLTEAVRESIGVSDQVAFVGMNRFFRMMAPATLETFQAQALKEAGEGGLSLPVGPPA